MKQFLKSLFVLLLVLNINVKADELNIVDFTKKGSISVTLLDPVSNLGIKDTELSIYKLADATSENHNLVFNYNELLNIYKDNIKTGKLSNEIINYIKNNISSITKVTDSNGNIKFNDLDLGLYLIVQSKQTLNYSNIDSFLIYTPAIINNKWSYDIEATPKVDLYRLFDLSVKKVWNVNDNNIPKQVTIELLKNDEVIDSVILNKENNWEHTWVQIEESDAYSVREINIPIDFTATYRKENNVFIVTNTKTLIQTGNMPWIIYSLAISGLIFISFGYILQKRQNHE